MNDITLESYLICDESTICSEINQIAMEGINLPSVGSAGQNIIDKFKTAADSLVKNKNPKTQKGCLETMKASVDQVKADFSKKKITGTETAAIIVAILGITATVLVSFGFVKLAGKIKNALKKNDPNSLERDVQEAVETEGPASEGWKEDGYGSLPEAMVGKASVGFASTFLNYYDHPNITAVSYLLIFIVLPLIGLWKLVKSLLGTIDLAFML